MSEALKLDPQASDFYALVYRPARFGCLRELRGLGCAEEEAEELFMATLLAVMSKVDPIARDFLPAQMISLMKIAARRRMIDTRRHQNVLIEVDLDRAAELGDAGAASPDERVEAHRSRAVAHEALLFLPPRDRLVYFLRFQMDLSPAEIQKVVPGLGSRKYRKAIERSTPRARAAFDRIESGRRCREIGRLDAETGGSEEKRLIAAHLCHCLLCQRAFGLSAGRRPGTPDEPCRRR
jgi:RNA polymerase sigma factor (sigma-70 family)